MYSTNDMHDTFRFRIKLCHVRIVLLHNTFFAIFFSNLKQLLRRHLYIANLTPTNLHYKGIVYPNQDSILV